MKCCAQRVLLQLAPPPPHRIGLFSLQLYKFKKHIAHKLSVNIALELYYLRHAPLKRQRAFVWDAFNDCEFLASLVDYTYIYALCRFLGSFKRKLCALCNRARSFCTASRLYDLKDWLISWRTPSWPHSAN